MPDPQTDSTRKKIIIVDDVISNLDQARLILDPYYQVYPAASAKTMFKFLDKFVPDLILLDIEMPDINGYEAIKMLKADNRYINIPVIFLSAKCDEESEQYGKELGAAAFISKPFSPQDLIECIGLQLIC